MSIPNLLPEIVAKSKKAHEDDDYKPNESELDSDEIFEALSNNEKKKKVRKKKVNKDENYIPDEIDSEEDDGAKKSNRAKKSIFKK